MDRILISDLLVRCIIGIRDDERKEKQDVLINLSLSVDLRKAGRSDRIEDAVDYAALKKRIVGMAEGSQFFLVEALAERIAEICLERREVSQARVRVEKPTALRFARNAGVEITRDRGA
jgi:FolB domain-containing protein